jgi:hypothetical protein
MSITCWPANRRGAKLLTDYAATDVELGLCSDREATSVRNACVR